MAKAFRFPIKKIYILIVSIRFKGQILAVCQIHASHCAVTLVVSAFVIQSLVIASVAASPGLFNRWQLWSVTDIVTSLTHTVRSASKKLHHDWDCMWRHGGRQTLAFIGIVLVLTLGMDVLGETKPWHWNNTILYLGHKCTLTNAFFHNICVCLVNVEVTNYLKKERLKDNRQGQLRETETFRPSGIQHNDSVKAWGDKSQGQVSAILELLKHKVHNDSRHVQCPEYIYVTDFIHLYSLPWDRLNWTLPGKFLIEQNWPTSYDFLSRKTGLL